LPRPGKTRQFVTFGQEWNRPELPFSHSGAYTLSGVWRGSDFCQERKLRWHGIRDVGNLFP
jgi:hypothetical protein